MKKKKKQLRGILVNALDIREINEFNENQQIS